MRYHMYFSLWTNRHQCKKNFNFEYKRYIQVLNYVIKVQNMIFGYLNCLLFIQLIILTTVNILISII